MSPGSSISPSGTRTAKAVWYPVEGRRDLVSCRKEKGPRPLRTTYDLGMESSPEVGQ